MKKLFKKYMILLSLLSLILSISFNTIAAPPHAEPQTPEERSILMKMYNLPGSETPRPLEEFLEPLSLLYKSLDLMSTRKLPVMKQLTQLIMRINLIPHTVFPNVDATTLKKQVEDIVGRWLEPNVISTEKLLNESFTILDTDASHIKLCPMHFLEVYHQIASHCYAKDLAELYFKRVDKVNRPRVLIVGSGRYIPIRRHIYAARCFPGCDLFLSDISTNYRSGLEDGYGNVSYDERYYGTARWDYFLVDYDYSARPDAVLDILDPRINTFLGENQWDYIINEANGSEWFEKSLEENAKKLLKQGGKILDAMNTYLSPEKFDPSIGCFGRVTVRYTKQ